MQPNSDIGYRFWARTVWGPNSTFLACLYWKYRQAKKAEFGRQYVRAQKW